ncbi:MAG: hypothetical protein U0P81_08600 [Holophagaceae bacterium]
MSTNQGIGRTLYGSAQPCETCGSVLKTLWWVFLLLPVVPLGSYRVITFEEEVEDGESVTAFASRRAPFHWPHLLKGCGTSLAVLAFLLWILASRAR